jgi:hypothetical protein
MSWDCRKDGHDFRVVTIRRVSRKYWLEKKEKQYKFLLYSRCLFCGILRISSVTALEAFRIFSKDPDVECVGLGRHPFHFCETDDDRGGSA